MGLGNPGPDYADTRHNVGFWLADALAARWKLPRFKREGGPGRALATGGRTPAGRVHLLKPQSFMNDSGRALAGLHAKESGAPLPDVLVLVDDFALPVGTFRIRGSGSAGGHNGLKSIEQQLRTQAYARLRIGIGPLPRLDGGFLPETLPRMLLPLSRGKYGGVGWHDFVLEAPTAEERQTIRDLLPTMCEAVECWMSEGVERAMAQYNRKAKGGSEEVAP